VTLEAPSIDEGRELHRSTTSDTLAVHLHDRVADGDPRPMRRHVQLDGNNFRRAHGWAEPALGDDGHSEAECSPRLVLLCGRAACDQHRGQTSSN
jgi:hypothetical protein